MEQVPVIDLSQQDSVLVPAIARACSTLGFFQVVNHGIEQDLIQRLRVTSLDYFRNDDSNKLLRRRNEHNARGYFDDELTKQKRDWKQCIDVGVPGSRDWNLDDDDEANQCLDGCNKFPNPELRDFVVEYFEECGLLADRLARLMAQGILPAVQECSIVRDLRDHHTSYLRLNYYPVCNKESELGISPHRDAGFLTILLQDETCHSLQVCNNYGEWHLVVPEPNALTINTGDMAQIWSNGVYQAPLHRVLTSTDTDRFSAPFFYNPGYQHSIAPVSHPPKYYPCLWGYFRALRFAGDLCDLGVEIQISDYEVSSTSSHPQRQQSFAEKFRFDRAFSVEKLRELLQNEVAEENKDSTATE